MTRKVLTPSLTISSYATLQKIRELPIPGEVLVTQGQQVTAQTVIARAALPGDLSMLRIPEQLGIEPSEVINILKIKEGDVVKERDILCTHIGLFGLFKNHFYSPCSGTVELISQKTGHVGIRSEPEILSLSAYISGKVVSLVPKKSVTIETSGIFVQGIFGLGGERAGQLELLNVDPAEPLLPKHLPTTAQAKILVGGTSPSLATIKAAAESGAVGLVVGSIDDQAMAGYLGYDLGIALTGDEDVPMSLIVTEGFGSIPLSGRVLSILSQAAGKSASINGATQVRAGALRPEIIVPLENKPAQSSEIELEQSLEIGRRVRVIRIPYFGAVGTVTAMPHAPQLIETGAHTRVLSVKLSTGIEVVVPRANVELI